MATADGMEQSHLDIISKRIIEVFDRILSEVRARRDELLAQVDKMRNQSGPKNDSVPENIRGLEEMRAQVEKITVKQNLAMKKQQESLADIDSEIEKLKIGLVDVRFSCSIDQLIYQVKQFGNVVDGSTIESLCRSKVTAVRIMQKHIPKGSAIKLHIDNHKQLLYVYSTQAYEGKLPISIFNANDFAFIKRFGPVGNTASFIVTGKEFIYIGIFSKCYVETQVLLHKQSDYSLVKEFTFESEMCSMFTNPASQILILVYCDQKYLLQIYDRTLNLQREVKLIYECSSNSITHSLLRDEMLYILQDQQILVFNIEGRCTNIVFEKGKSSILRNPTSFHICGSGYIIVADSGTNSIKFFSPEGKSFHKIGEDTVSSDVVIGASDVVGYKSKLIVACYNEDPSYNNRSHLRIY